MSDYARRPEWLKVSPLDPTILNKMGRLMRDLKLHTICESARCPNCTECFRRATATFMILGDICTRDCTFCAVKRGSPLSPDPQEPEHIVTAVDKLGLRYVVVTSSLLHNDLSMLHGMDAAVIAKGATLSKRMAEGRIRSKSSTIEKVGFTGNGMCLMVPVSPGDCRSHGYGDSVWYESIIRDLYFSTRSRL